MLSRMLICRTLRSCAACLGLVLIVGGCGDATPPNTSSVVVPTSEGDHGREGYAIPFPMKEYWGNSTILKYDYEMRFGPSGKVERNGWGHAYYGNGDLEREGAYLDGQRAGKWTYYTPEGAVDRVEDRGGNPPWTGPGQLIPAPGTDP